MRKYFAILIATLACALCFALAGCGGGGSSYEKQTVEFDDWTITITNHQFAYDEKNECDNLLVFFTATNNDDKDRTFNGSANMQVEQDGEHLFLTQLKDDAGESYYDFEQWTTSVAPGESIDLVYGSQLISESPVQFVFSGYSSDIVDAELEFTKA